MVEPWEILRAAGGSIDFADVGPGGHQLQSQCAADQPLLGMQYLPAGFPLVAVTALVQPQ